MKIALENHLKVTIVIKDPLESQIWHLNENSGRFQLGRAAFFFSGC